MCEKTNKLKKRETARGGCPVKKGGRQREVSSSQKITNIRSTQKATNGKKKLRGLERGRKKDTKEESLHAWPVLNVVEEEAGV